MPSVETLSIITGIGGWVGVWHAASVYFEEGPLMIERAFKMASLPLFWGSVSLLGYIGGVNAVNLSTAVFGSMFHPVPFIVNLILTGLAVSVLSVYVYIKGAFRASVDEVAAEIAADTAAAAAAAAAAEATDSEDEETAGTQYADGEADGETDTESETDAESDTDMETYLDAALKMDSPFPENDTVEEAPLGDVVPTAITDPVAETARLDAELDAYTAERDAQRANATVPNGNSVEVELLPAGAIPVSPVTVPE